jgi:hypothetical protein
MSITLGSLRFVAPAEASVADLREEREWRRGAECGVQSAEGQTKAHGQDARATLLSWPMALAAIYPESRSYSTFKRLTSRGVRAGRGGPVVVLGTVARPGGRCCTLEQVQEFVRAIERGGERNTHIEIGLECQGVPVGRAAGKPDDARGQAQRPTQPPRERDERLRGDERPRAGFAPREAFSAGSRARARDCGSPGGIVSRAAG